MGRDNHIMQQQQCLLDTHAHCGLLQLSQMSDADSGNLGQEL